MSGITVGRRVEWAYGNTVFRGDLLTLVAGGHYGIVRDRTGLSPRIVRADRLRQPGYFALSPREGAAA